MNLTDAIRDLAERYVEYPDLVTLACCSPPGVPVTMLAMQLSLASENLVDALLCDVQTMASTDDHSICCRGACSCIGPYGPFAHPRCDGCDQVQADRLDQTINALLGLIHPRILGYIKHVSEGVAA